MFALALACGWGCVPAIIGAVAYSGAKTKKEQRQAWTANFNATNIERESHGLQPLDWCSEAYRFDRTWAAKDPECLARIKRYEKGDKLALDQPGTPTISEEAK